VDFIKLFLLQAAEAMRRLRPSRVNTGLAEAGSRRPHWLKRSTITDLKSQLGLTKNPRHTNSATGTSTKDKLHTPAPASRVRCTSFFFNDGSRRDTKEFMESSKSKHSGSKAGGRVNV
jgi:hypothetical protein